MPKSVFVCFGISISERHCSALWNQTGAFGFNLLKCWWSDHRKWRMPLCVGICQQPLANADANRDPADGAPYPNFSKIGLDRAGDGTPVNWLVKEWVNRSANTGGKDQEAIVGFERGELPSQNAAEDVADAENFSVLNQRSAICPAMNGATMAPTAPMANMLPISDGEAAVTGEKRPE